MKQCICTHWYQAASKQKGMHKLYAKKNQQKRNAQVTCDQKHSQVVC